MDATMENKMGLPPPYEQVTQNAPPPSYFGNNPPQNTPGFVIPPTAPPRTMVITPDSARTVSNVPVKLGPGPTGTVCPTCNKSIVTRVDYVPNNKTHIASAILCVVASCCCACFIPYCMTSCKTANHFCPSCQAFLGAHDPQPQKQAREPRAPRPRRPRRRHRRRRHDIQQQTDQDPDCQT